MTFAAEVVALRAGVGDPRALVGEFRRTAVLVPVVDGGLLCAEHGGVRWLHAFTDLPALAGFARGEGAAPDAWEYRTVLGARLLDTVLPALPGPTGVVVDVADPERSMVLPPVRGIVPVAAAVDGPRDADAREGGR